MNNLNNYNPLHLFIHGLNAITTIPVSIALIINSTAIHRGHATMENFLGMTTSINTLGNLIISYTFRAIGQKLHMKKVNVMLWQGSFMITFNAATIISAIALGTLNPIGAIAAGINSSLFISLNLLQTHVLYKKHLISNTQAAVPQS